MRRKEYQIELFLQSRTCLILLALLFFSIPFFAHADLLAAGKTVVSGDGTTSLVDLLYLKNSLKELDFPLWSPYLAGGHPYANLSSSVYYPLRWLAAMAPDLWQLYVYFGLHYAIGGVFMFLYLKKIGNKPAIALMVSVIYLFTVHMGGHRLEHVSLVLSALYVPVIFYFLERYLQEDRFPWLLCASIAMALQYIGGFLQYVIYTDIFACFYLLYFGIRKRMKCKKMLLHGSGWVGTYFALVAVCVLPLAQFILRLNQGGGTPMTKESFASLSLHPIKLLEAVFPLLFGEDFWTAQIDRNWSSGMDIELLIGAAAVALILAGFLLIKKNRHALAAGGLALLALLYACMDNIPCMTDLFYHVPVLNMFRLPSRSLFLFTFFSLVLLALALQELYENEAFERKLHLTHLLVAVVMLAAAWFYCCTEVLPFVERLEPRRVFLIPFGCYGVYLLCFYGGRYLVRHQKIKREVFALAVILVLMLTTLFQTMPYYLQTNISDYDKITYSDTIGEGDTYKVMTTVPALTRLSFNSGPAHYVQSMNSYNNFNLPELYKYCTHSLSAPMNASGLYMGCANFNGVITNDNQLLSMLGVKYLQVPENTVLRLIDGLTDTEPVYEEAAVQLFPADGYQYAVWPIDLEKDGVYSVSFTAKAASEETPLYVDFAVIGYDEMAQQADFVVGTEKNTYTAILPADDPTAAQSPLQFRIIVLSDEAVEISNVHLEKGTPRYSDTYRLLSEEVGYWVYENTKAEDLVFAPQSVRCIREDAIDDLYVNTQDYDILHTSYICADTENDFNNPAGIEIRDIQLSNNCVVAEVYSPDAAFVNMSQNYYPGWKVYVDGQKQEVYEVNGIIQGTFVPEGTHTVEFKYQPDIVYIGAVISLSMLAVCVISIVRMKKKERV